MDSVGPLIGAGSRTTGADRLIKGMRMMLTFDPICYDAYARLMARPDPPDLPRRANLLTCDGDPERRSTRLPPIIMGWLQRRFLEVDGEAPVRAAARTSTRRVRASNPGLRLLRPTGTGWSGVQSGTARAAVSLLRSSTSAVLLANRPPSR